MGIEKISIAMLEYTCIKDPIHCFQMAFDPANRLPPDFDDFQLGHYDPNFSKDINTKMHIPDRLAAFNGPDDDLMRPMMNENRSAPMTVPERILVAGETRPVRYY